MKKVTTIFIALSSQLIFSQDIALPEIPEKLDKDLQVCLKTIAQYSYINSKEAIEKDKDSKNNEDQKLALFLEDCSEKMKNSPKETQDFVENWVEEYDRGRDQAHIDATSLPEIPKLSSLEIQVYFNEYIAAFKDYLEKSNVQDDGESFKKAVFRLQEFNTRRTELDSQVTLDDINKMQNYTDCVIHQNAKHLFSDPAPEKVADAESASKKLKKLVIKKTKNKKR